MPYIGPHDFHNHGIMDLTAELEFVVKHEYHETDQILSLFYLVVKIGSNPVLYSAFLQVFILSLVFFLTVDKRKHICLPQAV